MKYLLLSIKKILVIIWNKVFDYKIYIKNNFYILKDTFISKMRKKPKVSTIDETLDYIINNQCSVSRYGDGELKLMNSQSILFQEKSEKLRNELIKVIKENKENHIVCIPDIFEKLNIYSEEPYNHWKLHRAKTRSVWYSVLDRDKNYYNAFISRCYYAFKDKSNCEKWFNKLKLLWEGREIVIIEGQKSRLGIGNDLFAGAKTIERILCPEKNAFSKYDEILNAAKECDKSKLIILAIGPTATVLAYDLHLLGYQAIDLGHIDIEYEWFKMGAIKKEKVSNKFVGEALGGMDVGECRDEYYLNQIVTRIN